MDHRPKPQFEPIDPRWLLKAAGIVVLAALVCAYLTLCLLFYQGQWQLVLHPESTPAQLTTLASLPARPIRFDATVSGTPRLSGALLPAAPGARYAGYTVLYLRGEDGSLARSTLDARNLAILHALGLPVFAFDYRGYGQSDPIHPTEARLAEDADAAFQYLRDTRTVPEDRMLLFGVGPGASLATNLAARHAGVPAVILEPSTMSPLTRVLADPRTRLLPVRLLFHETFSLDKLSTLATPKLLILEASAGVPRRPLPAIANPKFTLDLQGSDNQALSNGIARFLGEYLPAS